MWQPGPRAFIATDRVHLVWFTTNMQTSSFLLLLVWLLIGHRYSRNVYTLTYSLTHMCASKKLRDTFMEADLWFAYTHG